MALLEMVRLEEAERNIKVRENSVILTHSSCTVGCRNFTSLMMLTLRRLQNDNQRQLSIKPLSFIWAVFVALSYQVPKKW
jgi:hypothetical protein